MTKDTHIAGVILAGGQGRRMGHRNKGLVHFAGHPLVEQVAARLKDQVSSLYVSCNEDEAQYQKLGFQTFGDHPFPSEGPLCAIASAVQHINAKYILFVPCDCPIFPATLCKKLFKSLEASGKSIAIVENQGRDQPLFLLLKKNAQTKVIEKVKKGERKVFAWLASEEIIKVSFSEAKSDQASTSQEAEARHYFTNLNTLSELDDLEKSLLNK